MGQANLTPSANHDLRHRFEELQRRASKDALSGLLNRATVEHCIKQRLAEMAPEDTCALFIVDLDDFKRVNDTLGHQAGDQAIRRAGTVEVRVALEDGQPGEIQIVGNAVVAFQATLELDP